MNAARPPRGRGEGSRRSGPLMATDLVTEEARTCQTSLSLDPKDLTITKLPRPPPDDSRAT